MTEEAKKTEDGKEIIEIDSTPNYGYVYPDTDYFDDQEFFGENILNYKLHKIKVWVYKSEAGEAINGIQMFYKERRTGEIVSPGSFKGPKSGEVESEFVLEPTEYIVDFHISIFNQVSAIEFVTSHQRIFKAGGDKGEEKITKLKEKNVIILAGFGGFRDSLHNFGVYFVKRRSYYTILFSGFFYLRYLLKHNETFKKGIMDNLSKYTEDNQALVKICLLPDTSFLSVMRYALF